MQSSTARRPAAQDVPPVRERRPVTPRAFGQPAVLSHEGIHVRSPGALIAAACSGRYPRGAVSSGWQYQQSADAAGWHWPNRRSGELHSLLRVAASPPAPAAPRAAASRDGASPALWAHRGTVPAAARACLVERVSALGFDMPDEYLAVRRAQDAAAHRGGQSWDVEVRPRRDSSPVRKHLAIRQARRPDGQ